MTLPTPGSKASQKKAKNWKSSRRGKKASRPRAGAFFQDAGGDTYLADTRRLRAKLVQRGDVFLTGGYSIERNGNHVTTGWQGKNPPTRARAEVKRMYMNGSIKEIVATFFPVPSNL
jgi:hypothetical protein